MARGSEEIIVGINAVKEALRGKRRAFELFVAATDTQRIAEVTSLAGERGIPVRRRDRRDLDRLAGTPHHQGVALRVEEFAYADLADLVERWRESGEPALFVLLDGVQDPHNLGALIRSAACAGAHGVVIPRDRAVGVTATVEKVAAGGLDYVPVARVSNLGQAMEELKREGVWLYGAAGEASQALYDADLRGNVGIVLGSEGEGLRDLTRKKCDFLMAIPMGSGMESLNVSVAGGIMMFEALRQRRS